jgi:arylformamidase
MHILDISLTITEDVPHYPGKVSPQREIIMDMEKGHIANCSTIYMDCHVGTHIDSPRHFTQDGKTIDRVDLTRLCGPCRVIEIKNRQEILPADLESAPANERILFKTCGSALLAAGKDDPTQFAYLTPETAERLVALQTLLVGIDGFSVDRYGTKEPAHHILLPAGIPILECINLSEAEAGDYELIALPLKIGNSEAAPARAILRRL